MAATLAGKVAVITGGVSGIGLGSVEMFVAEGAKVVVGDIQDELGAALAARFPDQVDYLHADVADAAQVEALVQRAVERFGRLDVMFNNAAGGGDRSPLMDLTAEGFDRTLRLITGSVVAGHTYAARQFVAQGGGGSIITTASGASFAGGWSSTGYTIAKHAVVGVVHTAAAELGPLGIRSNAIAPGIIMTPILARSFGVPDERSGEFEDFLAARLAASQPIGRVGRPADIARAAVFLASDASEWITGVVLPVDGGAAAVTQGDLRADFVAGAKAFHALGQDEPG